MIVPIVFATNNYYMPYLSTTLQSIIEHSSVENQYKIFILEIEITDDYKKQAKLQVEDHSNFSIQFINVSNYIEEFNPYIKRVSIEAYFRLLIPYVLNRYEKVLYLDCDLICQDDVAKLYNFSLDNSLLGCAKGIAEINAGRNNKNNHINFLGLNSIDEYFNSGVLLFNIKKISDYISLNDLLSFAETNEWKSYDQDVLNIKFEGQVKFFPNKWNFIKVPILDKVKFYYLNEYQQAEDKAKIIHFAAGFKPWNVGYYVPNAIEFWKYASRTPFYKEINMRMEKHIQFKVKEKDLDKVPFKELVKEAIYRIKRKLIKK